MNFEKLPGGTFEKKIDIYEGFEKEFGRYYHGSPYNVEDLKSSNQSGNIRPGEEERRMFKDVIFLTKDINEAIRYAGPGGVVYHVDANAIKYKDLAVKYLNTKKSKSVGDNIYVAKPEDLDLIVKWVKEPGRKKNEPEKYTDFYVKK